MGRGAGETRIGHIIESLFCASGISEFPPKANPQVCVHSFPSPLVEWNAVSRTGIRMVECHCFPKAYMLEA